MSSSKGAYALAEKKSSLFTKTPEKPSKVKKCDENTNPKGTPFSYLKVPVQSRLKTSSPATPLSSHNRPNLRPTTPRAVSPQSIKVTKATPGGQPKQSNLKKMTTVTSSTPKRNLFTNKTNANTPKTVKTCKSPKNRPSTPNKVENPVVVQFSQELLSTPVAEAKTPTAIENSLNEGSLDPFGMRDKFNRSHSASSIFRVKSKEEMPVVKIRRSLSEAKISLNSSTEPEGETSRLTVGVRVRPLLPREGMSSIQVSNGEVKVASDLGSEHSFKYDHCFSSVSSQLEVYEALVHPLLDNAFQGYNACLFAYGQTGSGKSYSMMGPYAEDGQNLVCTESGMIPRFCQELLKKTAELEESCPSIATTVEVSYLEVYNEKIHDLLVPGNSQLRVREHPVYGPYVVDLSRHTVNSFEEFQHWINIGNKKRAIAATELNDKSSRSHSLFSVLLTQTFAQVRSDGTWSHDQTRRSQINLVDLAGSERIANSTVSTDRLREGVSINRSLLTLGKVMSALVEKRGFVPYRESVLTWLLKESLGGNSRTCMLATVSPCSNHMDETLSTLRYASQARSIVNRVRVNEAPQDREIRQLREELERLRGAGEKINNLLGENEDLREKLQFSEDQKKLLEVELDKTKVELARTLEQNSDLIKKVSDKSIENGLMKITSENLLKLESQIGSLKDELVQSKEHNLMLIKELNEYKQNEIKSVQNSDEILNLQKEIKHLQNKLMKTKFDFEDALKDNNNFKEVLQEKELECKSLKQIITENQSKLTNFEKELATIQENLSTTELKLSEAKENSESLQKKLHEYSLREERLKQDLEQIPALESALSDLEGELRKSRSELFEARRNNGELQKRIDDYTCSEDLLAELQRCKSDLATANELLSNERKKLEESIEREELLKIKVEKIPGLESDLRLAEAESRKAKRELEEYLSQGDDSNEDITEGNDTVYQNNTSAKNECNLTTFQDEIEDPNSKLIVDLNKQIEELNEKLVQSKLEKEESDFKLRESRKKVLDTERKLKSTLAEKDDEILKLENEIERIKQNFSEDVSMLEDLKTELENQNIKLEQCKESKLDLKIKLDSSIAEKNTLSIKVSYLENEIKKIQDNLSKETKLKEGLEFKLAQSSLTVERLQLNADQAITQEKKVIEELERKLAQSINTIETMKQNMEQAKQEKVLIQELEAKLAQNKHTINLLQLKVDQAIQCEIELGKCKEELHRLKSSKSDFSAELTESKSREDLIKTELAIRNQQVDGLQCQIQQLNDIQSKMMEEKRSLIKAMNKNCCCSNDEKKLCSKLTEENAALKKDVAILKEKLSEKENDIHSREKKERETVQLLKGIILKEDQHTKALEEARALCDKEIYESIMDAAFPHHLVYLTRKARKFTEMYKIPYEFEIEDKDKAVILRHLLLSAKAKLSHLQLSKWVERIENEKMWSKQMDRDIPWEVDFRDYYERSILQKVDMNELTEVDSAINCGVQVTAAGYINPILWRKTMVKRHVMGIKEDSDVLIQYFNEIEDSRVYSILSRIQVSAARLKEATENVEK